eukprot:gene12446-13732_t
MADFVQPSESGISSSLKAKLRENLRGKSQQRRGEPTESLLSRLKTIFENKSTLVVREEQLEKNGENNMVNDEAIKNLLDSFQPRYFCCVGLRCSEFEEIARSVHVELKNKEELKYPFQRIASKKCLRWVMKVRNEQESTGLHMRNRLKASSNFAISKLIPISKQRRILANSWKREEQRKELRIYEEKLQEFDVELDETQNSEMKSVVEWINHNAVNDLETLLADCENQDISDAITKMWYKDTEDRGEFYRDQFYIQGKEKANGHRWSVITYRNLVMQKLHMGIGTHHYMSKKRY